MLRMRPLLQHASRSVLVNAAFITPTQPTKSFIRNAARSVSTPSICVQCRYRTSIAGVGNIRDQLRSKPSNPFRRRFHQTPNDERKPPEETERAAEPSADPKPPPDVIKLPSSNTAKSTVEDVKPAPNVEPTIADVKPVTKQEAKSGSIPSVPAKDLPSHREAQRWDYSKRLTELMDELLPKLALVTQKVNTLTGTDYSGIEALKREIKEHGTW